MSGQKDKPLRSGFTTGTAAAAATQAALICLLTDRSPEVVHVRLPMGETLAVPVHACRRMDSHSATCSVIKDAGDDPDITHGAEIGAQVSFEAADRKPSVAILGGLGVGRVTKPGLEVPVGDPAINPIPREMIRRAVRDVLTERHLAGRVAVEIFVPEGEALARHTLNGRLGIVGGISILGTTGIVRPLSHAAYVATIDAALSVARASGVSRVVFTTGRRSERLAQERFPEYPEEAFVQMGDFFAKAMEMAAAKGFSEAILAVFFGKAVKMAQGIPHTHAHSAPQSLETLARWTLELTGDTHLADRIAKANTARHAYDLLGAARPAIIDRVAWAVVQAAETFGGNWMGVRVVVFGFDGTVVGEW